MTWWGWLLIFVLIAVLGAVVIGLQLRSLWHKATALADELGRASDSITALTDRLEELETAARQRAADERAHAVPAVFEDPLTLRRERHLRARENSRRA